MLISFDFITIFSRILAVNTVYIEKNVEYMSDVSFKQTFVIPCELSLILYALLLIYSRPGEGPNRQGSEAGVAAQWVQVKSSNYTKRLSFKALISFSFFLHFSQSNTPNPHVHSLWQQVCLS